MKTELQIRTVPRPSFIIEEDGKHPPKAIDYPVYAPGFIFNLRQVTRHLKGVCNSCCVPSY